MSKRNVIKAGDKFGRWTVIEEGEKGRHRRRRFRCRCECGKIGDVWVDNLKSGHSTQCKSCATTKHGLSETPTYKTWEMMLVRCGNRNYTSYKDYGGRGITVCERWKSFENFVADMGIRPLLTELDRLDNNRGYEPDNCHWTSRKTNCRNRRNNKLLKFRGETSCVADFAERTGLSEATIHSRLKAGKSPEESLTKPSPSTPPVLDQFFELGLRENQGEDVSAEYEKLGWNPRVLKVTKPVSE